MAETSDDLDVVFLAIVELQVIVQTFLDGDLIARAISTDEPAPLECRVEILRKGRIFSKISIGYLYFDVFGKVIASFSNEATKQEKVDIVDLLPMLNSYKIPEKTCAGSHFLWTLRGRKG